MSEVSNDPIIGAGRVAELTGAPVATVRHWDARGIGPKSFKMNGRRVWRESVVLDWIHAQETAGDGPGAA